MFDPWVGDKFGEKDNSIGGLRLMILGESHYTHSPNEIGQTPEGFTTYVINEWALNKRHRFFTNLMQVVTGRHHYTFSKDDIGEFWRSVVFYNYVPVLVDGQHRKPTDAMFRMGPEPLKAAIAITDPSAVLVCGDRLWGWLAPTLEGIKESCWDYALYDDGTRVYGRMHHPSMAFSSDRWAPRVRRLVAQAAQPRQVGGIGWDE